MCKSNEGIILEDCLISFMILSTFLVLILYYMDDVYQIKSDIANANEQINQLKLCMLATCEPSTGNQVAKQCSQLIIKNNQREVCIEI